MTWQSQHAALLRCPAVLHRMRGSGGGVRRAARQAAGSAPLVTAASDFWGQGEGAKTLSCSLAGGRLLHDVLQHPQCFAVDV